MNRRLIYGGLNQNPLRHLEPKRGIVLTDLARLLFLSTCCSREEAKVN
jgi:hypothetical protein